VGSSGAGKSTLVHLIPRFFDVTAGRLLIDGRDVRDTTLASLPGKGVKRIAILNGGTIPDRGLYGVFLSGERAKPVRVGELDEEMVFESKPGETFVLGASTWRIEEITHDRVLVAPAPGDPGKMPFWHGDRAGRPMEFGRRIGALVRELREMPAAVAITTLVKSHDLEAGGNHHRIGQHVVRRRFRGLLGTQLDLALAHHVAAGCDQSDHEEDGGARKTRFHGAICVQHADKGRRAQKRGGNEQGSRRRGRQRGQPQCSAGRILDVIDQSLKHRPASI